MEESEIFETEAVVVCWRFVLTAVPENLVPDRQGVLFMFPAFFSGEVGDWGAEPCLLSRVSSLIEKV